MAKVASRDGTGANKNLSAQISRGSFRARLNYCAVCILFFFLFIHRRSRTRVRGERRNREERGRKLLPFTINLHNFTFSLAAYGSERKTTCSRSSGVRLACEISAITPQKKKRPCRLLSQMLWILFFLITADPQLTDTLSLSLPSHPLPPTPPPVPTTYQHCIHFFQQTPLSGHL